MVQVKLNLRGIRKLKQDPGVRRKLNEVGKKAAAEAGDGIKYVEGSDSPRVDARGYLLTVNKLGERRNAKHHVLLKAIARKYD